LNDPKVLLVEFVKANLSSSNPTLTQMSGRIFTAQTERPFMAPSLVVGPAPEGTTPWLSTVQIWNKHPVPVTAYKAYDMNPMNTSTTEQTAKIQRWNLIDGLRTLIQNNKNLSTDGKMAIIYNYGTPREVNLTKWRPGVMALVQTVMFEYVDDLSNAGTIP